MLYFLYKFPKEKRNKSKHKQKLIFISSSTAKTSKNQTNQQNGRRYFPNNMTEKALISKTYTLFMNKIQYKKETKQPNEKRAEDLKIYFPKKTSRYLITSTTYKKRCSTLMNTKELYVKTTMRHHPNQSEWPSLKRPQLTNAGEGVEKREHSYSDGI